MLSLSSAIFPCFKSSFRKFTPPSTHIREPNSEVARWIASLGEQFHQIALGFLLRMSGRVVETTMRGTGVRAYGSLAALRPPMRMASQARRAARNTDRSADVVTPALVPDALDDPSLPNTRKATTLTCLTLAATPRLSVDPDNFKS